MRWPPYKHIFFDCDSTLSTIEGIDVLARMAGKQDEIERLTNLAMDGHIDLEDVYAKRLRAIEPTSQQIAAIRQAYKRTVVEDAEAVIALLKAMGCEVYIISGGLYLPVLEFGVSLGVSAENIRAVHVNYDQLSGNWWQGNGQQPQRFLNFDKGPLTISDGKADIVCELLNGRTERALLIGDGNSDFRASRAVDLFVGFGGVVARQQVQAKAPAFIHSASLAPLLALALGPGLLNTHNNNVALSTKAYDLIDQGAITFNDDKLKTRFNRAYQAVYTRPR